MTGRTSKAEARREEILEAAAACFREKGLRGASISHICARLKISPGHLYYYFRSKDAIIEALLDQMRHAQTTAIERELDKREGALEFFLSGDYLGNTELAGDAHIADITIWEVYAEAARDPHGRMAALVGDHWNSADKSLRRHIEASMAAGSIRPDADVDTVLTLMCMAIVTGQMAQFADPNFDPERYKAATRLVLAPYAAGAVQQNPRPARQRQRA
jgi:AcrR family transcriptional regulator